MLKDIKHTSKHTAVYALGNIMNKVIGLLLIPWYTDPKYLTESDYGALAILEATSQLLIGLLTMAMIQSLTRWYWDKAYRKQQNSVFFTTIAFLIVMVVPVIGVLLFNTDFFSVLLFESVDYSLLLKYTIAAAGIQVLNNQVLCLAKVQSKSVLYAGTQVAKLVLVLGLILWGIIIRGEGLVAIWRAYFIVEALTFFALMPYAVKNMAFKFQKYILREMMAYGFPLMLASVSAVVLQVTDRYMLSDMKGLEQTGVYSMGGRIANTLKLVITTSLGLSLSPLRMKKMNEPDNHRFYAKILTYSAYIFIIGLLFLSLFSLEGLKLFTGSAHYWEANGIVPILAFSLFFGLLKDNAYTGLTIMKKTKIIGTVLLLTSILNIGLNLLLIPMLDIYGAALATLTSQLFMFIVILIQAQKAYKIPYEMRKILLLIVLSGAFIVIGIFISGMDVCLRLGIKISLFVSFPFILHLFGFYEKVELENIKKSARLFKSPGNMIKNFKKLL